MLLSTCVFTFGVLFASPGFIRSYQATGPTPTAPPPPMATNTLPPPANTSIPLPQPVDTPARSIPPGRWASKTPTITPTSTVAELFTQSVTPIIPQTVTLTPFLNLHVVVYLDMNQNKLFDIGEGVNDLLLLVNAGSWSVQTILQNGEAWLALPPDLPSGSDVQVQSPYLHWSDILRAPKTGEVIEASLRLEQPQFPVSLP